MRRDRRTDSDTDASRYGHRGRHSDTEWGQRWGDVEQGQLGRTERERNRDREGKIGTETNAEAGREIAKDNLISRSLPALAPDPPAKCPSCPPLYHAHGLPSLSVSAPRSAMTGTYPPRLLSAHLAK